jgi:aspartate oxidase
MDRPPKRLRRAKGKQPATVWNLPAVEVKHLRQLVRNAMGSWQRFLTICPKAVVGADKRSFGGESISAHGSHHGEMKLKASLMRKESRCSHYRLDYPEVDSKNWNAWINIYKSRNGSMKFEKQAFGSWLA